MNATLRHVSLSALLGLGLAGCGAMPPGAGTEPELRLETAAESPHFGTVEAVGLDPGLLADLRSRDLDDDGWTSIFAVYTGTELPAEGDGKPPVAGSYAIDDGRVRFRPRYPLVEGLAYTARFDLGPHRDALVSNLTLPRPATAPATFVTRVYPTADVLPENLLRLYLHFSAPMSRGEAYEHVRVVDEDSGEGVEAPFVEIAEELWDPEMRRLTLLFDPGRIKRGLRPHLEAGPPLNSGGSYRLVIDAAWPDARGLPLKEGFEKPFRVIDADRISPDPGDWTIEAPAAGTRDGLVLRFPESLDHALLHRVIHVRDAGGGLVEGFVETGDGERVWSFEPAAAWPPGSYRIEVETVLEDLAGNNLKNVFDVDLKTSSGDLVDSDRIILDFVVSPSQAPG